jgi:hypothetical protein
VVSREIVDRSRETSWTISDPEGLVDPSRIEPEVPDQLTVSREHPDVPIGHEDQDGSALVPAPNGDVVEVGAVAQRHLAGVDLVLADPTMRWDDEGLARGQRLLAGPERPRRGFGAPRNGGGAPRCRRPRTRRAGLGGPMNERAWRWAARNFLRV